MSKESKKNLMTTGCIENVDKIFREFDNITTENKRHIIGKYATGEKYHTNLLKSIPIYEGPSICHHKFDFTLDGPRCFWCNTISLLTKNGDFNNEIIEIKHGVYNGQKIIVENFEKTSNEFGRYEPDDVNFLSHLNSINDNILKQRMINKSCDASHDISISSILNSFEYPFRSRTLSGWICDKVNIVKLLPYYGNINNVNFTNKMMKDVFFQIFLLAGSDFFNHGSPSSKYLSVTNKSSSFRINENKKITMDTTLFVDPGIYSSCSVDYNNRKLYFVGQHSLTEIEQPNWNVKITLGKSANSKITKSPSIKKYLTNRILTVKLSLEMMSYIQLSGINVFPQIYLFLYMTIALLNRSFFNEFTNSDLLPIFRKIFILEDYEKYMNMIESNLDSNPNENELLLLLINCDINIRTDVYQLIGNEVASLY